jgi:hypothetical protein
MDSWRIIDVRKNMGRRELIKWDERFISGEEGPYRC